MRFQDLRQLRRNVALLSALTRVIAVLALATVFQATVASTKTANSKVQVLQCARGLLIAAVGERKQCVAGD